MAPPPPIAVPAPVRTWPGGAAKLRRHHWGGSDSRRHDGAVVGLVVRNQ
jgi:hypothetical protein